MNEMFHAFFWHLHLDNSPLNHVQEISNNHGLHLGRVLVDDLHLLRHHLEHPLHLFGIGEVKVHDLLTNSVFLLGQQTRKDVERHDEAKDGKLVVVLQQLPGYKSLRVKNITFVILDSADHCKFP